MLLCTTHRICSHGVLFRLTKTPALFPHLKGSPCFFAYLTGLCMFSMFDKFLSLLRFCIRLPICFSLILVFNPLLRHSLDRSLSPRSIMTMLLRLGHADACFRTSQSAFRRV